MRSPSDAIVRRSSRNCIALLLLWASGAMAVPQQLLLSVDVSVRVTEAGTDDTFVPFSTEVLLDFDPTWVNTEDSGTVVSVFFGGGNQFDSPLTALMPWTPPDGMPPERQQAVYSNYSDGSAGEMYWDDRYLFVDESAGLEYRYAASLNSNPFGIGQFIDDIFDFGTEELLQLLDGHRLAGTEFYFNEYAWIYDFMNHATVHYLAYAGFARLTAMSPPAPDVRVDIPEPPVPALFVGGLTVLAAWRLARLARITPPLPRHLTIR